MTAAPAASQTDLIAADPRPVRRVLIANRGEIALRIVRACRDLGIASVAAYTAADADALFVSLADDAYRLDGSGAAETYLSIPTMIDLAKRAGADAVHPGYGYLAESGEFATAVTEAGLTWVGPTASAIDALGDKAGARAVAQAVGAPVPQGSPDPSNRSAGRWTSQRRSGTPSRSRPCTAVAGADSARPPMRRRSPPRSKQRPVRPRPLSAAASASSSSRSSALVTSRPSASRTRTVGSSWSPPATARFSAATRRCSRRPQPPASRTSRSACSQTHR